MILTTDIRRVLSTLDTSLGKGGTHVRILGTLDRKLYLQVNEVLESLGGKWTRGAKAHVFAEDPTGALEDLIEGNQYVTRREADKALGFFPTPPTLAKKLVEWAGIGVGSRVLEPSAGEGAIVRAARESGAGGSVTAVEVDRERWKKLCDITMLQHLHLGDFLTWQYNITRPNAQADFDAVVMNPPFGKRADLAHVRHAVTFLRPGGRLVAVMSAGVMFREDKATRDFRAFAQMHSGEFERLPDGSFSESGTQVNAVVLRLVKAECA